eukprot:CAMPEP_0170548148 /NCGR_PEP_ID=MMETSP0211-20121228/6481_1 /TAXON_ID=311385 /ORGANISM="Pseudokeronopsis sp., Strain OXSARD2" /LENGTH=36 /DNA_ID= /DNA_START= /DNA_END= /DNA_ORIENTATION=
MEPNETVGMSSNLGMEGDVLVCCLLNVVDRVGGGGR